jgi:hypothetical protein
MSKKDLTKEEWYLGYDPCATPQLLKNVHRVPKEEWNKWSDFRQQVYNSLVVNLRQKEMEAVFPMVHKLTYREWRILTVKVAWIAARMADDLVDDGGWEERPLNEEDPPFPWDTMDTSLVEDAPTERLLKLVKHMPMIGIPGWGTVAEICKRLARLSKEKT